MEIIAHNLLRTETELKVAVSYYVSDTGQIELDGVTVKLDEQPTGYRDKLRRLCLMDALRGLIL